MPSTCPLRICSAAYWIRDASGFSLLILTISGRTKATFRRNVLRRRKLTYHGSAPQAGRNGYDSHGPAVTVKTAAQPRLRPIEGRHNPRVKELRQAFDSADLTADGYCAVEGMHLVEEAIRSGLRFRAVY